MVDIDLELMAMGFDIGTGGQVLAYVDEDGKFQKSKGAAK